VTADELHHWIEFEGAVPRRGTGMKTIAWYRSPLTVVGVVLLGCLAAWALGAIAVQLIGRSTLESMDAGDWAAWAQAAGSVVAVVVGAIAIWWQVREQGRQQQRLHTEDEIRRLQIVGTAFFHCRALLETMKHRVRREVSIEAELEQLISHVQAMYAIPAMDVPDWRATYAIASARSVIETLRRELSGIEGTGGRTAQMREGQLNVALSYVEAHEETVSQCLERRGSHQPYQEYTYDVSDGSEPLRVLSYGHPGHLGLVASDFA
jgi:hypothetical protein